MKQEATIMARKRKPINPEQKYCSPRQAAPVMGISEYLLYRMFHEGKIPGSREVGGRILIPVAWVMGEAS